MLMTEEERKCMKEILINKFRGDIRLFDSGVKILEELCNIPLIEVIPDYKDIYIEEEDSVMLRTKNIQAIHRKVNIVVVWLRHLSNFTDFNILELNSRVHLYYTNNIDEIGRADIVLMPESKNRISDLYELRRNVIFQSIIKAYKQGAIVTGICGGYQMMEQEVCDPLHVRAPDGPLGHLVFYPLGVLKTGRVNLKVAMEQLDKAVTDQQRVLESTKTCLNRIATYSGDYSKILGFTLHREHRNAINEELNTIIL
jgi:adenosylcobyric acid synthase